MEKFVILYRNVNLGHPKSPTRTQLEQALSQAGAVSPVSFQTNGTAVFSAQDLQTAEEIATQANQILAQVCGLQEPAMICRLDTLIDLVDDEPFAAVEPQNIKHLMATFVPTGLADKLDLPHKAPRGELEIIRIEQNVVLSVIRQVGASFGSPTVFVEKMLQIPATTRAWTTILRLVKKFGKPTQDLPAHGKARKAGE